MFFLILLSGQLVAMLAMRAVRLMFTHLRTFQERSFGQFRSKGFCYLRFLQMNTATVENVNSSLPAAAAVSAHVAEAKTFLAKVQALSDEGNALKPNALEEIVRNLGKSANKFGRPTELAFTAYMLAMASRNLSIKSRVQLATLCNSATPHGLAKPPFKIKGDANSGEIGLSVKLSMPARFETELG